MKDYFEEAVVARNMLEACEFLSFDSCQKSFLYESTRKFILPHT